ncbi:Uncharacterised protein [Raoultella ornithinolytica]|nr:Uncharacterised protein [Raoultella ornithinolytica]
MLWTTQPGIAVTFLRGLPARQKHSQLVCSVAQMANIMKIWTVQRRVIHNPHGQLARIVMVAAEMHLSGDILVVAGELSR